MSASDTAAPLALDVRGLDVGYAGRPVIEAVDIQVAESETVVLLGPSGSGKTTLLYAIAGFIEPSAGEIWLAGRRVADARHSEPPERRGVAMVFQHYALWPHLDALETVAYPLRRAGVAATEARRRAQHILDQLGVGHLAERRPAQMSGGEQQRVGLGRALARSPRLYLLDEPTAHLDAPLKAELRDELAARRRSDGAAALYATHDVEEALTLADRLVLLRDGRVVQRGPPQQVYEQPIDEWAARLTGPASVLDGELVRPEWARLDGPLAATVETVSFRGTHTDYLLTTERGRLTVRAPGPPRLAVGAAASCAIDRSWPLGAADRVR
ncbi:MAG TPA: ABC transporter ATP-binding protein [Candidatus Limnocylindrales bacterium]